MNEENKFYAITGATVVLLVLIAWSCELVLIAWSCDAVREREITKRIIGTNAVQEAK